LLEIALKVYERVIERRIRDGVHIHSNQFGFTPGKATTGPIFILRQVQQKDFGKEQKTILDICGSGEGI